MIDTENKYNLRKFKHRINWEITQQCNFNCSYCCGSSTVNKTPLDQVYTPQQVRSFFDKTNKSWLILITGGEPFLYPEFVEICSELTKTNHLQITTNLSHKDIVKFANSINPEKIFNISASYHHEIRDNTSLKDDFIKNCILLKEKGFPVLVNLIAHPGLFDTLKDDVDLFNSYGLETIVFGYRGVYKGKAYPNSFTKDELETIRTYSFDDTELKIALNKLDFYGHYCDAGVNYFGIKQNGDIIRCYTLPKVIGNIFSGKIPENEKARPCIAHQCTDCYNGEASVRKKKAGFFKIMAEKKSYYNK